MSAERPGVEDAVRAHYSKAAQERIACLCTPVDYDARYLEALPREILERDYGCGDPSRFVRAGETVLDLGSGGGKICYIAAQIAGPNGRVIGVDWNDEMLALAERHRVAVAAKLGYANVEFHKGKIQDLRLDYARVERYLKAHPIADAAGLLKLESLCATWRRCEPLIPDQSVDLVVSNCVLNLVKDSDKGALFGELYRVLKPAGRAAISDIVSDADVPERLKLDPELWSGCVSGAFREDRFLAAFAQAGFQGLELVRRDEQPWRVLDGIEFRSVTVLAHKGEAGPCLDRNQAVACCGPGGKCK